MLAPWTLSQLSDPDLLESAGRQFLAWCRNLHYWDHTAVPDWSSIWPNNSFARCARPKEETLWSLDLFLEVLYTLISWTCIDIYSSFSLYANFVRTTRNVQPNLFNQTILYLPAESEKKTFITVAEPNVSGAKPANNLSLMPTYCAYYLLAARLPKSRWLIWGYSSQRCSRNPSVGIWLSILGWPPRAHPPLPLRAAGQPWLGIVQVPETVCGWQHAGRSLLAVGL